jgi:tRNA-dependent cyclodipeptide synthase
MIKYNVSASGDGKWRRYKCGQVAISHGQPAHEGEKFEALLDWACRQFDEVVLNLSDTLYRHNLAAEGHNNFRAALMARTAGDEWLTRNGQVLNAYKDKIIAFHRWDDWLQHSDFPQVFASVTSLHGRDAGLRNAVAADAAEFLERRRKRGPVDVESFLQGSAAYLLEEIAVYILIGRTYEPARIYPSKDLLCFEYMRRESIPASLRGIDMTTHVNVNFKKKRSLFADESSQKAA